jgi:hypothetical protein
MLNNGQRLPFTRVVQECAVQPPARSPADSFLAASRQPLLPRAPPCSRAPPLRAGFVLARSFNVSLLLRRTFSRPPFPAHILICQPVSTTSASKIEVQPPPATLHALPLRCPVYGTAAVQCRSTSLNDDLL